MRKADDSDRLFRIGEAAEALELKTCVLRFWESEFPQLEPVRTAKGQRLYTEKHIELLRRIRSLLHEQGMTIDGARRVLSGAMEAPADSLAPGASPSTVLSSSIAAQSACTSRATPDSGLLRDAVQELQSLRSLLQSAACGRESDAASNRSQGRASAGATSRGSV